MQSFQMKNGEPVIIREARVSDAIALNQLVFNIISTSAYTLTTTPELDLSAEAQEQRIREYQEAIGSLILVVENEGQLIGTLDFKSNHKLRNRHWGEFGMGIHPDFRGQGLGRLILEELLRWARANPEVEKVCLGVLHENQVAHQLYLKTGFREEGRLLKAVKLADDRYLDEIRMYCFV